MAEDGSGALSVDPIVEAVADFLEGFGASGREALDGESFVVVVVLGVVRDLAGVSEWPRSRDGSIWLRTSCFRCLTSGGGLDGRK